MNPKFKSEDEARKLLANGKLIEAIKLIRGENGLDLKVAKDLVESWRDGRDLWTPEEVRVNKVAETLAFDYYRERLVDAGTIPLPIVPAMAQAAAKREFMAHKFQELAKQIVANLTPPSPEPAPDFKTLAESHAKLLTWAETYARTSNIDPNSGTGPLAQDICEARKLVTKNG